MNAALRRALGAAAACGGVLALGVLREGGVAVLLAAGALLSFVFMPLATALWRAGIPGGGRGEARRALADALTLAVAGALLAATVPGGTLGLLAAWLLIGALSLRGERLIVPLVGTLAVVTLGVGAWTWVPLQPDALLVPRWEALPERFDAAVVLAALGAGLGWLGGAPEPGAAHRSAVVPGVAGLFTLGMSLVLAADYELAPLAIPFDAPADTPLPEWSPMLALLAAGVAALCATRPEDPGAPRREIALRFGAGAALSLWFAGPAGPGIIAFFFGLLPIGLGAWLSLAVPSLRGGARFGAVLAATLCFAAGFLGEAPIPTEPMAAGALAAVCVAAFWYVATRAVRAEVSA